MKDTRNQYPPADSQYSPGNHWNSDLYDARHGFVSRYGESLLELLHARAGEDILDVGCGTGDLTLEIFRTGARVVGMDLSENMLGAARQKLDKAGGESVSLLHGDVRSTSERERYDAVFSNAVLHWVPEAALALQNIFRALRPGGRFVAELGGVENNRRMIEGFEVAAREMKLAPVPFPWFFPAPEDYRNLLEAAGFRVDYLCWFRRPTLLEEGGVIDWYRMFVGNWLPGMEAEDQERLFARATEIVSPLIERDGRHYADYVRLRVVAIRG